MKKRIISALLSAVVCIAVLPLQMFVVAEDTYCPFSGGSGTEDDPYQISTAYDLRLLSELVNDSDTTEAYRACYYIQTKDIDLNNEPWISIGTLWSDGKYNDFCFLGQYNGNYHNITNLNCVDDDNHCGLFGRLGVSGIDYTNKCVVSNLSVYGTVNSAGYCAGGIAGEIASGATIRNCSFAGDVSGTNAVGGIVGMTYDGGYVYNSYHFGTVNGASGTTGGIVGSLKVGQTVDSVSGGIFNSYHAGGIVSCEKESQGGIAGVAAFGEIETDAQLFLENNYYEYTSCNGAVNSGTYEGCSKLSADLLKGAAELLGTPFVDNCETDGFNDGYPIFEWQSTPYQFKGSGTAEDPYQISSKDELKKMRDLVNSTYFNADYGYAHYIQTSDIDLENELWIPIGTYYVNGANNGNAAFGGCYDGGRFEIENLYINESTHYTGLFGRIGRANIGENAVVKNVSVINGNVLSTANYVGGICGEVAYNSKIQNCSYNGTVRGMNYVGGIVGKFYQNGSCDRCYCNGDVTAEKYGGGIVGVISEDAYNVTVGDCYYLGTVQSADSNAGGIVGKSAMYAESTVIVSNCYYLKNGDLLGTNGAFSTCEVTALTSNLLKIVAADLGSPFVKNPDDTVNDGYPVFVWQLDTWGKGDINFDGQVNVADAVYLQGYLFGRYSLNEVEWQAANLIPDDRVDAFDMVFVKRVLIQK